jgi:hypothetical protein
LWVFTKNRKMIEVEPLAGLANRMRVIDSAYWLARDLGKDLLVTWTPYKGLNCSFFALFDKPEDFSVRERRPDIFHENRLFSLYFFFRSLGFGKAINLRGVTKNKLDHEKIPALEKKKKILIASVHQFYQPERPFYRFVPRDTIRERIDAVMKGYSAHTVGVHIRRADSKLSIQTSTTDKFVCIMNETLKKEPDTTFFLSTDSPEEELLLSGEFGEKVLFTKKELSRNSEQGIMDALVDLYCLGGTRKIIGSYYSSFSEVAARLQGIPLEIVT